jgi:Cys-tRNA(Pro)/Cys-tRNA(Cys) deacylase
VPGKQTPATRAAHTAGIEFRVHEYRHDPAAESYAPEVAAALEVEPERVFKTLVADVDGRLVACLVPSDRQLDIRALGKRAQLADAKRAESATGYVTGGISPLGQRRALPTLVDSTLTQHATVFVSGGRRGLELELAPQDLITLTGAAVRELSSGG